jgi:hypothetical protein
MDRRDDVTLLLNAAGGGSAEATFAALITVTNGVPIAVERAYYWSVNGVTRAGGTNATPIRLP